MRTDTEEFRRVFHDEMAGWIGPRRAREVPPAIPSTSGGGYLPKVDNGLVGLALSGGGVRSTTYALGVLQRLAKLGALRFVDLLSTASGGGYLGASWSSLAADGSDYGSGEANFPFKFIDNDEHPDRQLFDRESDAVRHLRAHGNWLAPRLGLFDVWTWVAVLRYVTSAVINLALIPLPWLLLAMAPTMVVSGTWWDRRDPLSSTIALPMVIGPAALLGVFMVFVWWQPRPTIGGAEIKHRLYGFQRGILVLAVAWALADLFVLGIAAHTAWNRHSSDG